MASGKVVLMLAIAAACCSVCSARTVEVEKVDNYMHCETCGKYSLIVNAFIISLYNLLMAVGLKAPQALAYSLHLTIFVAAVIGHLLKVKNSLIWDGISNMVKQVIANENLRVYLKDVGLKLVGIIECVLSEMHTALNW